MMDDAEKVGSAPRADRNAESMLTQYLSIAARAGREPYHMEHSIRGGAEVAACHPQLCDNTNKLRVPGKSVNA